MPNSNQEYILKLYGTGERPDGGVPAIRPDTLRLIKFLLALKNPARVLEIGSAEGYSGIEILKACGAHLTAVEFDGQMVTEFRRNIEAAGMSSRVLVIPGDAQEVLGYIDGSFDFILLDGPKAQYINYYEDLYRMLNAGGILYCDDVFFKGYVAGGKEHNKKHGSIIKNLREFLQKLSRDPRYIPVFLDVGDGAAVCIKI